MVRLREYYQDPDAPRAHDVLPAAFAVVRNSVDDVLLVRRIDDGLWELPGGRIEVGESAAHALIREVGEESGVDIDVTALAGIYSDPTHVLVDPDRSVHQQLAICFHAVPTPQARDEQPRADGVETDAAGWFRPDRTHELHMHPAMRQRLHDATTAPHTVHFD